MADIALEANLLADDSALVGTSKLFFYLWQSAWEHGSGTAAGDAEALHDMRVNLRRLRTAMQNFEGPKTAPLLSAHVRDEIREERQRIGALGDRLGAVRDFDVLEEYVTDYAKKKLEISVQDSAGLAAFLRFMQVSRAERFAPMVKRVNRALEPGGLRENFARWALGLPAAGAAGISLVTATRVILPRRLDEVTVHARALEPGTEVEEQHELRKSLRRVRYTLETHSVCFKVEVKPHIKRLVELQDLLGEMQDRAVLEEITGRCFGNELPDDVKEFLAHGVRRNRYLLGRVRTLWNETEKDGFWNELRNLQFQV